MKLTSYLSKEMKTNWKSQNSSPQGQSNKRDWDSHPQGKRNRKWREAGSGEKQEEKRNRKWRKVGRGEKQEVERSRKQLRQQHLERPWPYPSLFPDSLLPSPLSPPRLFLFHSFLLFVLSSDIALGLLRPPLSPPRNSATSSALRLTQGGGVNRKQGSGSLREE